MLRGLWPGLIAATTILLIALSALGAIWWHAPHSERSLIWQDSYLWHVVRFTLLQALLSTFISVLPAIPLARALYRRRFYGRTLLLQLCAMTVVLPVLVALFGLLTIYGSQGWLASLCTKLGMTYHGSIYGLQGILLAHLFFNLPLACRLLLQALDNIAVEQRQLAAQLGMNGWQQFRFVEWPALRQPLFSSGVLIFMLCFASFTVVMTLGGGPKATTIELAIYQALTYDFDLNRAALLAMIQLVCCIGLMMFSQRLSRHTAAGLTLQPTWKASCHSVLSKINDTLLIGSLLLLIVPPLLATFVDGLNHTMLILLQRSSFWQALTTSLHIGLSAAFFSVLIAMMLLWSSRELHQRQKVRYGKTLELFGTLILAMPSLVLGTGFFLLLNESIGIPHSPSFLIIMMNTLMALPFVIKILRNPMHDLTERYTALIHSLGMTCWQRLYWVELSALRHPLARAFAFACLLSMGDFGAIALFGNADFLTLPYYLYQQLSAYRTDEAAATALILLLICLFLFSLFERQPHADSR